MVADMFGNAVDPRLPAEIDCKAASACQRLGIEPEPAWAATLWEPAIGDDDVGRSTGAGKGAPVDPVSGSCGEQAPFFIAVPDNRHAGIARAVARRLVIEDVGIA